MSKVAVLRRIPLSELGPLAVALTPLALLVLLLLAD